MCYKIFDKLCGFPIGQLTETWFINPLDTQKLSRLTRITIINLKQMMGPKR